MSDGFSVTLANTLLDVLAGTAPSAYSSIYWQLHTGPPGANGLNNISSGDNQRSGASLNQAANGSNSLTGTAPSWVNGGITETITDVSGWSSATSGTFLLSGSVCLQAPTGVKITQAGTGGAFGAAATYYYVITTLTSAGESTASAEVYQTILATTDTITLNWTAVAGAAGYKIYRGTTSGGETSCISTISSGTTVTFTDTGTAGTPASAPTANTAGQTWGSGDTLQLTSLAVSITPVAA